MARVLSTVKFLPACHRDPMPADSQPDREPCCALLGDWLGTPGLSASHALPVLPESVTSASPGRPSCSASWGLLAVAAVLPPRRLRGLGHEHDGRSQRRCPPAALVDPVGPV